MKKAIGKEKPRPKSYTDYYPFGQQIEALSWQSASTNPNKYLYNGKELEDDVLGGISLNWYDFGTAMYDPILGRWHRVDPKAEKMRRWSTYAFCFDNPMRFIDPDGMAPGDPGQLLRNEVEKKLGFLKDIVNSAINTVSNTISTAYNNAKSSYEAFDKSLPGKASSDHSTSGSLPSGQIYTKKDGASHGDSPIKGKSGVETTDMTVVTTFKGTPSTAGMGKPEVSTILDKPAAAGELISAGKDAADLTKYEQETGSSPKTNTAPTERIIEGNAQGSTLIIQDNKGNIDTIRYKGENK